MSDKTNTKIPRDPFLTETFHVTGDKVTTDWIDELEKMVELANKDLKDGQLAVLKRTNFNDSTNRQVVAISSQLNIFDVGVPNMDQQHLMQLVHMLYYTTRGLVMTLNEQLEKEKKTVSLREFSECIIESVIDNAKGMSPLVLRFDKEKIIDHILTGVDDLDGIMAVDAETYLSEGRLNAFSFVLDKNYWLAVCQAAVNDIIKEMDAKAVRIALAMQMQVI